jgi:hypothetical protein
MPGTHFGQFDRGTNASNINTLINTYNTKFGNQPTPAGQVLVANNLMTVTQLQQLGGVAPIIPTAPAGQADFTWLRSFDLNVAWKYKFKESLTIEPSVYFYNLFNFANFGLPPNTMSGFLNPRRDPSTARTTRTIRLRSALETALEYMHSEPLDRSSGE